MPKEHIDSRNYGRSESETTYVHVGWTKNRDVQIGTLRSDLPTGDNGWFADLDRAGINRLIRTLRKARDQAYGPDA